MSYKVEVTKWELQSGIYGVRCIPLREVTEAVTVAITTQDP